MNDAPARTDPSASPMFLSGGGEVGALMRAHDWSRSPLGDPSGWPQALRTVVSLMLGSKFPMFCAWGEDLVFLYNDAVCADSGRQASGIARHAFPCDVVRDLGRHLST